MKQFMKHWRTLALLTTAILALSLAYGCSDDDDKGKPKYTVVFDGNGNTAGEAPAAITVEEGESITLPEAGTLAKDGFTLVGWQTEEDGGTEFAIGASFSVIANDTLFATWAENITSAVLTITAPVSYATPSQTATASGTVNFTIGTVSWVPVPPANVFEVEKSYKAIVTLTAKSGYIFAAIETATINAQTATIDENTGETLTLSCVFAETQLPVAVSFAVSTEPTKLAYTHGETLDLTGIVVTITYDVGPAKTVSLAEFDGMGITTNPANGIVLDAAAAYNNAKIKVFFATLDEITDITTNGDLEIGPATPALADFEISEIEDFTYKFDTPRSVSVEAATGKTEGAITVKYDGGDEEPTNAGEYEVTFDVAADLPRWAAASGLVAGTLTINKATPVAADFNISIASVIAHDGEEHFPTITPAVDNSLGAVVNVQGFTEIGEYTSATFDVEASDNYTSAEGLQKDIDLEIVAATPEILIALLTDWLLSQSDNDASTPHSIPTNLLRQIDLGDMSGGDGVGWKAILEAIETAGKFVKLDLSGSTCSGNFNPGNNTELDNIPIGEQYIVELVLPNTSTAIAYNDCYVFKQFAALTKITGTNVQTIYSYAFSWAAFNGGEYFSGPILSYASFPSATAIGKYAFMGVTFLESVTLGDGLTEGNFHQDAFTILELSHFTMVPIGNLREVYFAEGGGAGTYTTTTPGSPDAVWTKQ